MIAKTNATAEVHVALGSNLGDQVSNLAAAAGQISRLGNALVASSIWLTAPVGFSKPVPDFCNAVIRMKTTYPPRVLLSALQEIERQLGRDRQSSEGYESRTIDLDIVDYAGLKLVEAGLSLPHPRAHQRLFVLLPLQEVSPEFRFAGRDESLEALVQRAPAEKVNKSIPLIPSA
jgi:2-amino-4-hydroxy-6-hydroxymethyldihydropteridine diphosphokinase